MNLFLDDWADCYLLHYYEPADFWNLETHYNNIQYLT